VVNNELEDGSMTKEVDNGGAAQWWESLPEELKADPAVRRYASMEEAIRGLVDASKLLDRDNVVVPGKESPKEDWDRYYRAIGRPDNPDGYKLEISDADPEVLEEFRKVAFDSGMTPAQVEALAEFWGRLTQKGRERLSAQIEEGRAKAEQELRREWGSSFEAELDIARRAVRAVADPEIVEILESGLGNDPRVIRLFNRIGKMIGEDSLNSASGGAPVSVDAKSELARLKADPEFLKALRDPMSPAHGEAIRRFQRLHEIAYGG